MRSRLLERIKRLEERPELAKPSLLQYGWLKPLPKDYAGERHVVIAKRQPTASPRIEWCQFEERPGVSSAEHDDSNLIVCLTE